MKNPIALWVGNKRAQQKVQQHQDLKNRLIKHKEPILEIMAKQLDGNRVCSMLLGEECIGPMCNFFKEYKLIAPDGKETAYHQCSFKQQDKTLLEISAELRSMKALLAELVAIKKEERKVNVPT